MVDSDGNIDLITPLWLEAGINMLGPYEVAAGMDVVKVGKIYKDLVGAGSLIKTNTVALAVGLSSLRIETIETLSF